ncbi:alcohol dehydrogenase [Rouxiella silvae]|uniref:Alcohol dehydrogenase n=1 Tax=Rouxiella silvae TaxID=1646373 RepID=A0ABX3TZY8_9GAMM|nr:cytochrome c [Rouxiella silvae]ORJ20840.1 alcohol dehydrogenase [Rouxiella silvae]
MKKLRSFSLALLALGVSTLAQAGGNGDYSQVERGRYLAVLGDCAACHTSSVEGSKPFAGGVALQTPFGVLMGANITPDPDTGIGKWTFDDFQRAMSEGVGHDGIRLYGAMPFTAYTKVTKADNRAIWEYLQTLQPVHNAVQTNQLPFPFNLRTSLIAWNWINFDQGAFIPDLKKSADWNRGAYIVEGLGHCGTCHTPKNLLGGDKNSEFLRGAVVEGWMAPDITVNNHTGLGKWTIEDITAYLKTGSNRFDMASGPMAEEVKNSSNLWTDADLKAVAVYLKDSGHDSGAKAPEPIKTNDSSMIAGKAIYADRCSACHTPNGAGQEGLFPRLANSPLIVSDNATSLIHVVLAGSRPVDTQAAPTAPGMPSFAGSMSDADVANVLTYIRNSWGNSAAAVSSSDVKNMRKNLRE